MSKPIRIWLEVSHHAAFAVAGWAWVREDADGLSGAAGGERRVTAERAGLAGLVAALAGLPKEADVELHTASALVMAIPARIAAAQAGEAAPSESLDLWAQATTALASPGRRLRRTEAAPGKPSAFAAAWAATARDRAKSGGAFSAAIPKSNLAKAGV